MSTLYGSRDNNPFKIPNRNARYYTLINSETGETAVKTTEGTAFIPGLIGGESADRTVGTYYARGSNAGKFIPESGALNEEKQYFSSQQGSTATKNQAVITAQRGGATNAQQLIFPNTAQTATAPPQEGGSSGPGGQTPPAPSLPGTEQTAELTNIDVAGGRGSSGLRYPKLMNPDQDKIKFQACKISRSSSSITSSPKYDPVDGPVFLAIQSPISDQNSVDWGPNSVNAIDSFVYDKAYEGIKGELKLPTNADIIKELDKNTNYIQKFLAGAAAGLNNVLARTDNVVLNPNLELLFQGPQLRPFSFTFKMSARSQDEAKEIKSIIKYFKYHMAVRKETGLFLRAPHVFTIQYMKGEEPQHPGINLISPSPTEKACALTNCSVDYTPLGSYATYEDGTMAAYTLSLQFQELTPIYDTDYTDAQSIGY
jgi:hypothetical protein